MTETAGGITRRQLLLSSALGLIWPVPGALAAGADPAPLALILDGLPEGIGLLELQLLLAPLLSRFHPVGIASDALAPTARDEVAAWASEQSGLVEFLGPFPQEALTPGTSFDLARAMSTRNGTEASARAPLSYVARIDGTADPTSPRAGARSVGARAIFLADASAGRTTLIESEDSVQWALGGLTFHTSDTAPALRAALLAAFSEDAVTFATLSLAQSDPGQAALWIESIAQLLDDLRSEGHLRTLLPKDLFLRRAGSGFAQICLLLLDESAGPDEALAAFASQLDTLGIPYGTIARPDGAALRDPRTTCLPSGTTDGPFHSCIGAPVAAGRIATLTLWPGAQPPGLRGFDADGVLHMPAGTVLDTPATRDQLRLGFAETGDAFADQVIVLRPGAVASPSSRSLLTSAMTELRDLDLVRFAPLPGFMQAIYPDIWIADRLHRSDAMEARRLSEGAPPPLPRELLLQDAATAWAYFTQEESTLTGLSASTRFTSPDYASKDRKITMWDVASTINAILCAMELGLEEADTGLGRLDRILAALPTRDILGMVLPVAEVSYDSLRTNNRDFNGCDMGRLLIALKRAETLAPLGDQVRTIVEGWDLTASLAATGPIDVREGKVLIDPGNHCTDYALDGYRLWGIAPAEDADPLADFAARMRVLAPLRRLNPLGAEPHMNRLVEMGPRATSDLMVDLLLAAETGAHDETGTYFAFSETPLNETPWFSYQGLDVHAPPPGFSAQYETPSGLVEEDDSGQHFVFSAKAAYLAAALRPSAFTYARLDAMRQACATPNLGFIVGTYALSEDPMAFYADANTNGMILEAITYIIRGAVPLIRPVP